MSINGHATAGLDGAEGAGAPAAKVAFAVTQRQLDARTGALQVEGDLDLASAPSLKWALADVLGAGVSRLVVDLSHVSFIDSTALGVLVGANRNLDAGARIAIVCSRAEVLNIFELTGLDATFEIFSSFEDALAYVREDAIATE